jgi:hypothetical protein
MGDHRLPPGIRRVHSGALPASPKAGDRGSDDLVAELGRRKGDSVYKPTPTIDFILGTDDHLIGIAIHGDEALGLLYLLY